MAGLGQRAGVAGDGTSGQRRKRGGHRLLWGAMAQAEEGWADGNCCFISDSANLARPPLCLLPNYEGEGIRRETREEERGGGRERNDEGKRRRRGAE